MPMPLTSREEVDTSAKVNSLKSVAFEFVKRINAGDSDELMALMTEDYKFIDRSGNISRGRQRWDYFLSYPEYRIHVEHVLTGGNAIAIVGRTTGSHVPPEV